MEGFLINHNYIAWSDKEKHKEKRFVNTAQTEELSVARMGYSHVQDRISTLHFEYLIGTPGKIDHEIEKHELGLFTVDEMKQCFKDAGLVAAFDEDGISGRGLYTARKG